MKGEKGKDEAKKGGWRFETQKIRGEKGRSNGVLGERGGGAGGGEGGQTLSPSFCQYP